MPMVDDEKTEYDTLIGKCETHELVSFRRYTFRNLHIYLCPKCHPQLEKLDEKALKKYIEQQYYLKYVEDQSVLQGMDEDTKDTFLKQQHALSLMTDDLRRAFFTVGDFVEQGIINRFIRQQPIYYDENELFWLWDREDRYWRRVDTTEILTIIDKAYKIANTFNSSIKQTILEGLRRKGRLYKPEPLPENHIQFRGKIINYKTGLSFPSVPAFFSLNYIPWDIGESEETPTIDRLFTEWVGADKKDVLYEILAWCCVPSYFISRVWCFVGSGRNGKTTFLELVERFVGKHNCTTSQLEILLKNRFETLALYKKLVCFLGETNFKTLGGTSVLKQLTGRDLMRFEVKGGRTFQGYNYAKIIVATNALPATLDKTEGFYRRFSIIDWDNKFEERPRVLDEIPVHEFNNLAKKVIRILNTLTETCKFTDEGSIEERAAMYEAKSNPLMQFIKEECVRDVNGEIESWEFNQEFETFLDTRGYRKQSPEEIGRALKREGFEKKPKRVIKADGSPTTHNFIKGLRWRRVEVDVADEKAGVLTKSEAESSQNTEFRHLGLIGNLGDIPSIRAREGERSENALLSRYTLNDKKQKNYTEIKIFVEKPEDLPKNHPTKDEFLKLIETKHKGKFTYKDVMDLVDPIILEKWLEKWLKEGEVFEVPRGTFILNQ